MNYRPGDAISLGFTTQSISGAASDADSTPSASLCRNGAIDNTVAITITHNGTGDYMAGFTLPNTYVPGDDIGLLISATVGGVIGKQRLALGKLDRLEEDFFKTSGKVWIVDPIRGNDFTGNGTMAKPFATPLPTNATAGGFPIGSFPPSAGDTILIFPGTCSLAANQYVMTAGTKLIGAGRAATTITSTYSGVTVHTLIRFASGCTIGDLTIKGISAGGGISQMPLGDDGIQALNVSIENVGWFSDTDGIYVTGGSQVTCRNCQPRGNWTIVLADGASLVELYDSPARTVAQNVENPDVNDSIKSFGGSEVRLVRSPIENVAGNSRPNRLSNVIQCDGDSRITLIDSPVYVSLDGSTVHNFSVLAGGQVITQNSPYDPSLVSGIIIDLNKLDGAGSAGTGDTIVNENTGGADNLRFVDGNGAGIAGASIVAYLTTEWTANPTTAVARGEAFTKSDGRWATPMMLSHGLAYTLIFNGEPAGFQTTTMGVTV